MSAKIQIPFDVLLDLYKNVFLII